MITDFSDIFTNEDEKEYDKHIYRYIGEAHSIGGFDSFGDYKSSGSYYTLELLTIGVEKETPKGYWIKNPLDHDIRRFVLKQSRKKFANETKEGALQDFIHRKNTQISILDHSLRRAKEELRLALEFKMQEEK